MSLLSNFSLSVPPQGKNYKRKINSFLQHFKHTFLFQHFLTLQYCYYFSAERETEKIYFKTIQWNVWLGESFLYYNWNDWVWQKSKSRKYISDKIFSVLNVYEMSPVVIVADYLLYIRSFSSYINLNKCNHVWVKYNIIEIFK